MQTRIFKSIINYFLYILKAKLMRQNVDPTGRASQIHTPSTVVSTDIHIQGNDWSKPEIKLEYVRSWEKQNNFLAYLSEDRFQIVTSKR